MAHGGYPEENSDVEHAKRFPQEQAGSHHRPDRMFKDPYTADGRHFRVEDNTNLTNHFSNGAVVRTSMMYISEPLEGMYSSIEKMTHTESSLYVAYLPEKRVRLVSHIKI